MQKLKLFVPDKAPSHRQEKVAEEVKHLISKIIVRGDLPTLTDEDDNPIFLNVPVTVTRVSISPDLKHATVYIMPLGGENKNFALEYLTAVRQDVRYQISKKLALRISPVVDFALDRSFDHADRVAEVLDSL